MKMIISMMRRMHLILILMSLNSFMTGDTAMNSRVVRTKQGLIQAKIFQWFYYNIMFDKFWGYKDMRIWGIEISSQNCAMNPQKIIQREIKLECLAVNLAFWTIISLGCFLRVEFFNVRWAVLETVDQLINSFKKYWSWCF